MPIVVETLTIQCRAGTIPSVLAVLEPFVRETGAGCWVAELGLLNRIIVMRTAVNGETDAFQPPALLWPEAAVVEVERDLWRVVGDAMLPPGDYGPIYEFRCYDIFKGEMSAVERLFLEALPARLPYSPLLTVMVALDDSERFCHVWPYRGLDKRASLRREAVAAALWPPKGVAPLLETMRSEIYLPAPFSTYR